MNKIKILTITAMSLLVVASLGQQALGQYGGAPAQSSAGNYTVEINSDKESYNIGESITFSGSVNKYDEDRSLRISIFNSDQNLILTQKTSVNADTTFSHKIILDEQFLDGKYTVRAQYGNSQATVERISFVINSNEVTSMEQKLPEEPKIPDWVKNIFLWYGQDQVSEDEIISAIQFLVKEGIIKLD